MADVIVNQAGMMEVWKILQIDPINVMTHVKHATDRMITIVIHEMMHTFKIPMMIHNVYLNVQLDSMGLGTKMNYQLTVTIAMLTVQVELVSLILTVLVAMTQMQRLQVIRLDYEFAMMDFSIRALYL